MNSVYSPDEHVIYSAVFYDDYQRAGTWPANGIEISDDDAVMFNGANEPHGKMLDYINNQLCWVERPEPVLTPEQLIARAEQKKTSLRLVADAEISWRMDAVSEGMATEQEAADLAEWKRYRVLLMRIDTSATPDIEWPTQPGIQAS